MGKARGGNSTGSKIQAGRQRGSHAKTIRGNEMRHAQTERSLASARVVMLEEVGRRLKFMSGKRTRGPNPTRISEA